LAEELAPQDHVQASMTGHSIGGMLAMALRRWGAWIVVADGLVWLADGLITREFAPTYWSATRFIDYAAVLVHTGGLLLLAISLAAIHQRQADVVGVFGRVAFLVAFVGAALAAIGDIAEDGLRIAAAGSLFMGGMVLLGAGLLLFGIASLRARTLSATQGMLLLLSLVVGYPLGGLWSSWFAAVLLGLVWIALGGFLIHGKLGSQGIASSFGSTRFDPSTHFVHSTEED
jgi:hypothetical protein